MTDIGHRVTSDIVFLYVPVPDPGTATKISQSLLKEGVAACTNLLPAMESTYWWHGKIETSKEQLLIVKTDKAREPRARAFIETLHPYEVPCIATLPISTLNLSYANWLKTSLG